MAWEKSPDQQKIEQGAEMVVSKKGSWKTYFQINMHSFIVHI